MMTLVTGASGFVGRNVIEELLARGEEVLAVDLSSSSCGDDLFGHSRVTFRPGDLRDSAFLQSLFGSSQIRTIVHLATITAGGTRELECSGDMIETNVACVDRLMKAAVNHGCDRVIYVGSGSAYGRAWDSSGALEEQRSASVPDTIYGITKLAGEAVALRLGELSGLDVRAVRLGTVFGPWERETGAREAMSIYLQIARLALQREEAVLPRRFYARDWIYSRDAAAGIVALGHAENLRHRVYHLTSGIDWHEGVSHWCEALASTLEGFSFRLPRESEPPNVFDSAARNRAPMLIDRIRNDIGFTPRYGPQVACRDFLGWLQEHRSFILNGAEPDLGAAPQS